MTILKYHQPIFDYLRIVPEVSSTLVENLEKQERKLGFRCPPSFREWYTLDGTWKLIMADGGWHQPLRIEELGDTEYDSSEMLVFQWENQWVCCWGVCLDGTDDPEVRMRYNEPDAEWEPYTDHFSTFVHIYLRKIILTYIRLPLPFTMKSIDEYSDLP